MATAALENNNPYTKFGLKRRPTYDELIGLINENASLFGPTPDRRASAFKASPEGSFFDGLNYTDKLKEEQERILNKQMRDILFRQNVGNQTISIAQLQNNQITTATQTETMPQETNIAEGLIQQQVQQRAQEALQRTRQTADEHQGIVSQMGRLPIFSRLANLTPTSRQETRTQRRIEGSPKTDDEPELMTEEEMKTARGESSTSEETILQSLKFRNPEASETQLTRALSVLNRYKNQTPEQIAQGLSNFQIFNSIYSTLVDTGFIDEDVYEEYQTLTSRISNERGGRKRAKLLSDLANHYRENIYDKFVNEISNRPSGSAA